VSDVDLEDLVHPREAEDDAARARDGPAAQSGTGAARDDGHAFFRRQLDDARDVVRRLWKDHRLRQRTLNTAIVLIEHEVFSAGEDCVASDDLAESPDDGRGEKHG